MKKYNLSKYYSKLDKYWKGFILSKEGIWGNILSNSEEEANRPVFISLRNPTTA